MCTSGLQQCLNNADAHLSISPELQTRGDDEENSKIFFFISQPKRTCCDPSLEPSQPDGSSDGSQPVTPH